MNHSYTMKTKLVYVLTCAPEANYIEQALMSVWSARYWNPDAHIVLITDKLTDKLFVGKRAEILDYISEKIVVPFEDDSLSMVYRSRWIKTSVRQLIIGNFLFIDCDTIVCKPLDEIDSFECEVGAVGDSNVKFQEDVAKIETCKIVSKLSIDISNEEYYYSSGVLYVKDSPQSHSFYQEWHKNWLISYALNLAIDQPSLAKANIDSFHMMSTIDNRYNCILFTQTHELVNASIVHIAAYRNPCFLFSQLVYSLIEQEGLQPWIFQMLTNVHSTYLPFDFWIKYSTWSQRNKWKDQIATTLKIYGENVDATFSYIDFKIRINSIVKWMLRHSFYHSAMCLWMTWKRLQLSLKRNSLKENICKIDA